MRETCIERIKGGKCLVYSTELKVVNYFRNLKIKHPDEVELKEIEEGIEARVPYDWMKMPKPPTKRNLTDEERKAMGDRLRKIKAKGDEEDEVSEP